MTNSENDTRDKTQTNIYSSTPRATSNCENTDGLKILTLNVCGIRSKVICPEFIELINQYDLIGLQETKIDDVDCVDIPDYDLFVNNRNNLVTSAKSVGIALLVHKRISKYISVIPRENKLVLWFSISKTLTLTENDILCWVVYIPPEGSRYAPDDPFSLIQSDLNHFAVQYNDICLFGDFNCRTKNFQDFVQLDDFSNETRQLNGIQDEYDQEMFNFDISCNVKKERINSDKDSNNN